MKAVDFHMHSGHSSDGELPPETLVSQCLSAGLEAISITDHNTVRGVREAGRKAKGTGLTVVPGIEIDCMLNGVKLHVLGYHVNIEDAAFQSIEAAATGREKAAFFKLMIRLEEMGLGIAPEIVLAAAEGHVPSPELVGEVLLESDAFRDDVRLAPYRPGGSRSDMPNFNFYCDFCTPGKVAFIPQQHPPLVEVVSLIKRTGGVAVLAHPGDSLNDPDVQLPAVFDRGVDAVEVFSSYHSEEEVQYFLRQAERYGKGVTCGSDFHGRHKPAIALGAVDCGSHLPRVLETLGLG